jgi:hypothetical protein
MRPPRRSSAHQTELIGAEDPKRSHFLTAKSAEMLEAGGHGGRVGPSQNITRSTEKVPSQSAQAFGFFRSKFVCLFLPPCPLQY